MKTISYNVSLLYLNGPKEIYIVCAINNALYDNSKLADVDVDYIYVEWNFFMYMNPRFTILNLCIMCLIFCFIIHIVLIEPFVCAIVTLCATLLAFLHTTEIPSCITWASIAK